MNFPGFIGGSYTLGSVNQDCQRALNLYAEVDESGYGADGEIAALVGRPTLTLLATLSAGPTRGGYTTSGGRTFIVSGNVLYEIAATTGVVQRGVINTILGRVSMADNGIQLMLVDGQDGFLLTLESNVFAQITDPDFPLASKVIFQDGYFLVNQVGSRNFWISTLEDGSSWDGLDFGAKEGQPDELLTIETDHLQIVLGGKRTMELWFDSGDPDFPFTRVSGAFIECGVAAADTLKKIDNSFAWLGADADGNGIAYRAQGYTPVRISTHAIEQAMKGYGDLSGTRSYTLQIGGNKFWVLNFEAGATWVYNIASQTWSEWSSTTAEGLQDRFRADWHVMYGAQHLVGDYANGNIYTLNLDGGDDAGSPVRFERTFPHFSKNRKRLRHKSMEIGMETGIGVDGAGQGSDPVGYLQWSDDGGHSWSAPIETSLGKLGDYTTRVIFARLGMARDRVYKFWNTEPIKQRWTSAQIDVSLGRS